MNDVQHSYLCNTFKSPGTNLSIDNGVYCHDDTDTSYSSCTSSSSTSTQDSDTSNEDCLLIPAVFTGSPSSSSLSSLSLPSPSSPLSPPNDYDDIVYHDSGSSNNLNSCCTGNNDIKDGPNTNDKIINSNNNNNSYYNNHNNNNNNNVSVNNRNNKKSLFTATSTEDKNIYLSNDYPVNFYNIVPTVFKCSIFNGDSNNADIISKVDDCANNYERTNIGSDDCCANNNDYCHDRLTVNNNNNNSNRVIEKNVNVIRRDDNDTVTYQNLDASGNDGDAISRNKHDIANLVSYQRANDNANTSYNFTNFNYNDDGIRSNVSPNQNNDDNGMEYSSSSSGGSSSSNSDSVLDWAQLDDFENSSSSDESIASDDSCSMFDDDDDDDDNYALNNNCPASSAILLDDNGHDGNNSINDGKVVNSADISSSILNSLGDDDTTTTTIVNKSFNASVSTVSTSTVGNNVRFPPIRAQHGKSGLSCHWIDCTQQFSTSTKMLEHIQKQHVSTQTFKQSFVCLWKGCKVYNRDSCSKIWLERHVASHSGNRPFRCIVDGCGGQRFSSKFMLERHIHRHFRKSEMPNNQDSPTSATKLIRRNGQKLRYRRQPFSVNARTDIFDVGIMLKLQYMLVEMHKNCDRVSLDTSSKKFLHIHFRPQIIGRRVDLNNDVKYLVRWHPLNVLNDEWLSPADAEKTKTVPLWTLPTDSQQPFWEALFPHKQSKPSHQSRKCNVR